MKISSRPTGGIDHQALLSSARDVRRLAYAPYSGFHVGAAVQTTDGTIFFGANIENASYDLTICAERSAIFNAIGSGHRAIEAIAIAAGYDETSTKAYPCGACLQVMAEFMADDSFIILGHGEKLRLKDLFPHPFRLGRRD